jgi:hypothetical protein
VRSSQRSCYFAGADLELEAIAADIESVDLLDERDEFAAAEIARIKVRRQRDQTLADRAWKIPARLICSCPSAVSIKAAAAAAGKPVAFMAPRTVWLARPTNAALYGNVRFSV